RQCRRCHRDPTRPKTQTLEHRKYGAAFAVLLRSRLRAFGYCDYGKLLATNSEVKLELVHPPQYASDVGLGISQHGPNPSVSLGGPLRRTGMLVLGVLIVPSFKTCLG